MADKKKEIKEDKKDKPAKEESSEKQGFRNDKAFVKLHLPFPKTKFGWLASPVRLFGFVITLVIIITWAWSSDGIKTPNFAESPDDSPPVAPVQSPNATEHQITMNGDWCTAISIEGVSFSGHATEPDVWTGIRVDGKYTYHIPPINSPIKSNVSIPSDSKNIELRLEDGKGNAIDGTAGFTYTLAVRPMRRN